MSVMVDEAPVWRSLLYVPANNRRFVDGAHSRGADAIILDLEDSVPLAEKAAARGALRRSVATSGRGGADVLVRINRPLRMALADIEGAVRAGADALWLSKVESPEHVRMLAEVVSEVEHEQQRDAGSTKLVAVVESLAAYFRAEEIARSDPRVVAMGLGSEDFALEAGMAPDADTLYVPKQTIQFAARAAGIMPLGFIGTVADYADTDAFAETVRRARRFGFDGAACVHPSGVPVLNAELTPTVDEVADAEKIMTAYEEAERQGLGAVTVDGKMVDVPVVERARRLLARAAAIAEKDRRKEGSADG
ncbi:MAG: CoA ester lyase [Rhodospirillaceae bacterium]|nr:CoA ester lyase [Rhodospirillaceae bacterium]